jgi:hypothetical protein
MNMPQKLPKVSTSKELHFTREIAKMIPSCSGCFSKKLEKSVKKRKFDSEDDDSAHWLMCWIKNSGLRL